MTAQGETGQTITVYTAMAKQVDKVQNSVERAIGKLSIDDNAAIAHLASAVTHMSDLMDTLLSELDRQARR